MHTYSFQILKILNSSEMLRHELCVHTVHVQRRIHYTSNHIKGCYLLRHTRVQHLHCTCSTAWVAFFPIRCSDRGTTVTQRGGYQLNSISQNCTGIKTGPIIILTLRMQTPIFYIIEWNFVSKMHIVCTPAPVILFCKHVPTYG